MKRATLPICVASMLSLSQQFREGKSMRVICTQRVHIMSQFSILNGVCGSAHAERLGRGSPGVHAPSRPRRTHSASVQLPCYPAARPHTATARQRW